MSRRDRRDGRVAAAVAVLLAAVALAAATLRARRREPDPVVPRQGRRRRAPEAEPDSEDLTDRPVPRSVAALSTPPHFEQDPDQPEPEA